MPRGITRLRMDPVAIKRLFDSPAGPAAEALSRAAVKVDRRAKELAPVDTGRLRSSINWDLADANGLAALIGSNVEYAIHQELGTIYQPGTPYLRPALDSLKGQAL